MTHGAARINRESDVARVIPTRKEKHIASEGWGGEKNIFSASLQAVWPGRAKCVERIGYRPTSGL